LLRNEPSALSQVLLLPLAIVLAFLIGLVVVKRLLVSARRSSRR